MAAKGENGSEVDFAYRKSRRVEREDWIGRAARWVGAHPILGGLIGGLCVVAFAAVSVPEGIASAPREAAILSLLVVGVWVVLFFFMRNFFRRQGEREMSESYRFVVDDKSLRWERDGEQLRVVENPKFDLRQPPGADAGEKGRAAVVWLVVRGEGGPFVLETKVTSEEASQYEEAEGVGEVDEELPIHLASALLQQAERAE